MTNLDLEFLNWRDKNEEDLISRWNAIKEDYFLNFIEECWREYQDENNLVDDQNETVEELVLEQARERHYESKKVQENGLNPQIEAFMDAERNKEKNHL